MVIGSMLARELNSMNSCGSVISNTLGSLKYLVSLGNEDLVRDSLWNVGEEGGLFTRGTAGFSVSTGKDSVLAGAEDFSRSKRLFSAHP